MGGYRVGEVRAGTKSPMPDHKDYKLQYPSVSIQSIVSECEFSTLRVKVLVKHVIELRYLYHFFFFFFFFFFFIRSHNTLHRLYKYKHNIHMHTTEEIIN